MPREHGRAVDAALIHSLGSSAVERDGPQITSPPLFVVFGIHRFFLSTLQLDA